MTLGAGLVASLLITLARPSIWPLAFVAFLLRGGIVVVLAPIVVLPSAVGLANVLAPAITSIAFGGGLEWIRLGLVLVLFVAVWACTAGVVAAAAEVELVRQVATEDDVRSSGPRADESPGRLRVGWPGVWRVVVVRLLALVPLLLAMAGAIPLVVEATYRELTDPSSAGLPLAVRVAGAVPLAISTVLLAWGASEIVAGLAVRGVVRGGLGIRHSLGVAAGRLVRNPLSTALSFVLPLLVFVAVLVVSALAAGLGRTTLRSVLADDAPAGIGLLALLVFVGLWAAGLVLVAATTAWRGAVWSVTAAGTIGAAPDGPAGDWRLPAGSGRLPEPGPRKADPERGDR